MDCNGKNLDLNKTNIMGILNVTPDSFSDGGKYNSIDSALYQVDNMISNGASIIDVGGESTRPGHTKISDEEEISRVVPVIEEITKRFKTIISIDTYKSQVAKAAIDAGADIINDIWGLQYDDKLANVVINSDVPYILMLNRSAIDGSKTIDDLVNDMQSDIDRALTLGIKKSRIIIDPGVGFAKTKEQDLAIIANLSKFKILGYPLLLGASKKSYIGYVMDIDVSERGPATLASTAAAIANDCEIIRVHDVKENYEFITMFKRIKSYWVR